MRVCQNSSLLNLFNVPHRIANSVPSAHLIMQRLFVIGFSPSSLEILALNPRISVLQGRQSMFYFCKLKSAPVAVYQAHHACCSIGVISPLPTALKTPPAASEASLAQCMSGKEKLIGLSFGEGAILSIQSLRATASPVRADDIVFCVKASAWPSRRLSIATVALFLEPFGFPALPLAKEPSVFLPYFMLRTIPNLFSPWNPCRLQKHQISRITLTRQLSFKLCAVASRLKH